MLSAVSWGEAPQLAACDLCFAESTLLSLLPAGSNVVMQTTSDRKAAFEAAHVMPAMSGFVSGETSSRAALFWFWDRVLMSVVQLVIQSWGFWMADGSKSARLSSRCNNNTSLKKGPGVVDIKVQGASNDSSLLFAGCLARGLRNESAAPDKASSLGVPISL